MVRPKKRSSGGAITAVFASMAHIFQETSLEILLSNTEPRIFTQGDNTNCRLIVSRKPLRIFINVKSLQLRPSSDVVLLACRI